MRTEYTFAGKHLRCTLKIPFVIGNFEFPNFRKVNSPI